MRRWLTAAGLAAVVAAAGCGGNAAEPGVGGTPGGRVTVFAAASLTEVFTALGKEFEAAHPGTTVTFNFGGSTGLATQLNAGAPADVFAAASPATMAQVEDASEPRVFARNQLTIAVPPGNPGRVAGLADIARPGVKVAVCAAEVPCGAAAAKALEAAGVELTPATLEQDVKAALTKLTLGEVDAALVYRTDVRTAGDQVAGVEFPESAAAVNDYPIAVLDNAPNQGGARAFVEFVASEQAAAALTRAGFQVP
jgi:molybdate transport system substrate-binding protein